MAQYATVQLATPIKRGEETIGFVKLRAPLGGELRGLKMADLIQLDVTSIGRLLPRISEPVVSTQEFDAMTAGDITAISAEIADFLTPRAEKPASPQA